MPEIIFVYKGNEIRIECFKGEKMKTIIERLYLKMQTIKYIINKLHNEKIIDKEITEDQIPVNGNNKKIILINDKDIIPIDNRIIKYSNEVICPICKELCLIDIKDYKILLYNCPNGHKTNISTNEFYKTQKIILSDIICNICKERNKGNIEKNNKFYKCLNCELNLCHICKTKHNSEHNIINFDKINYICKEHLQLYFGYCLNCNKNLCINCENEHDKHNIISYGKILKDKNEILENNNILKRDINKFKNMIKNMIKKLNNISDDIEKYYEINENIVSNINNKYINYEILFNINSINNSNIFSDIKNIISEKDINIQFQNIIKIYNEINYTKEILMKYKIEKNAKEIAIFGETFVKNNKDKCKYIYENKEYELNSKFNLKYNNQLNDTLEIKLVNIEKITDMSYLFDKCETLISVPNISEWDTSNIINMSNIFSYCKLLKSLPDISKWDTSKVINMNTMFWDCESLISLPDISEWDTFNIETMYGIFGNCRSLKTLPDISNWNMNNNKHIERMFYCCFSLISLPNISKWNTYNIIDMNCLFYECKELISLPNIAKWNTSNVKYMNSMFEKCSSLKSLPDISKWDTSNVNDMNNMFKNCSSLISLPDISKWDINNVKEKNNMFKKCSKLIKIPNKFLES